MKTYEEMTAIIDEITEANWAELIAHSDYLADNPELGMEEFKATADIKKIMEAHGWDFEMPFAGWETGFKATYGAGGHTHKVAIMAEFDALPNLGHACGHCVSGTISMAAALALAELQDDLDTDVHLIGTPAEESMGAKTVYVKDSVFDDYDAAMMIHMDSYNIMAPHLKALDAGMITFHGKSAHAAAAPWEGVNALNAAQLYLHALDMMRQHTKSDVLFHSTIHNGGTVPGIVPDEAVVETYWRCDRAPDLAMLEEKVRKCAEGAAIATGCTWEMMKGGDAYYDIKPNPSGDGFFDEVYRELDLPVTEPFGQWGSSDVGNVSYACPAFQPTLQIAPNGTALHTPAIAEAVKSDVGHEDIKVGGRIIARWIAKVFSDPEKIAAIKADFEAN